MDTKALAQRLHDYILKREAVTMTELYTLGKNKYTIHEMNIALREVHKMKDVTKRMKGGDVVYGKFVPKAQTVLPRIQQTIEEREADNKACIDFWEHSPLVSDRERACYRINWKSEECEELSMNGAEKRYAEVQKYGGRAKVIRERKALDGILQGTLI